MASSSRDPPWRQKQSTRREGAKKIGQTRSRPAAKRATPRTNRQVTERQNATLTSDAERMNLLLQQVRTTPGANLRQIHRYSGLPLSTTARILDELEEDGKIDSQVEGSFRRFYPTGKTFTAKTRALLGIVNKPRPRNILEHLLINPGITHGELAELVELPAPTLTYYMKQIIDEDIVEVEKEGAVRMYYMKDKKAIQSVIRSTSEGFDEKIAKG